MNIDASTVKELRERTGAGMMECKKALVQTKGDMDAAIDYLRKTGMAKAEKKADRVAAEGIVVAKIAVDAHSAALIEVNSETDFVSRDANFKEYAEKVVNSALMNATTDVATLMQTKVDGQTLEEVQKQLVAKLGEKIAVRRVAFITTKNHLGSYIHGGRIGAIVEVTGGDTTLAKDIAMHIAATRPQYLTGEQVPAALIEKEKEIYSAKAAESGKPAAIIEKMLAGQVKKFVDEITLVGQPFVKDPAITVGNLLKEKGAVANQFVSFAVGEGIEKKEENFRDEVMAQVKGSN
ncbi:MAG: elongation factor Ts [Gammaproteobacteria bacterium]|nr:elongation factor Ts [Gammaproteobacteria bacterium]